MASRSPAARVARNAGARAAGEVLGKLAVLALMAVLAREVGPEGLGVFVFGLAWAELSLVFIGPGLDRVLSRWVARDRSRIGELTPAVAGLQLKRAVPVVLVSWTLLWAFGYHGDERTVIYLLTASFLVDALSRTLFAVLEGIERSDVIGLILVVQRTLASGVGLVTLLVFDGGLTEVVAGYVAASVVALVLTIRLLRAVAGPIALWPRWTAPLELRRRARPLAAQELLSAGIARFDAVLVGLLAGAGVVGLYGAAYRLLEATLFVSTALASAFIAMFTYLDHQSEPTITAVVSRALKLSLALLTPIAVAFAIVPEQILRLFYGPEFTSAADTLRILAPTVILLGNVMLTSALAASRGNPRPLVVAFAAGFVVNVVANLVLVPPLEESGAALAMLATELVLAVLLLRTATTKVGRLPFGQTAGAPLLAGAVMAAVLAAVHGLPLPVSVFIASVVYAIAFAVAERRLAPTDFAYLRGVVGRFRRPRPAVDTGG